MKKFKKMVMPFVMVGIIATFILSSVNTFARSYVPDCTGVHHLNNKSISGRGYENIYVNIGCPDDKDTHNRAKIHFYNRSSEPVTVRAEGQAMTVQPWSGNSFNLNVSHGSLPITIRGLNDNSNQVLNGELSVKSWAE